jgi:hypothetical protein
MSESRPRISIPASRLESWPSAPDPFGAGEESGRRLVRARRQTHAILALGLLAITLGVAVVAGGSSAALDWAGVALVVLGIPAVVLGDARLGRISALSRGGPYATGADAGVGWGLGSDGGDCGGGFFGGGGDFGGGGGGGGDGGGGGC